MLYKKTYYKKYFGLWYIGFGISALVYRQLENLLLECCWGVGRLARRLLLSNLLLKEVVEKLARVIPPIVARLIPTYIGV